MDAGIFNQVQMDWQKFWHSSDNNKIAIAYITCKAGDTVMVIRTSSSPLYNLNFIVIILSV
jgi:hypothetical protein